MNKNHIIIIYLLFFILLTSFITLVYFIFFKKFNYLENFNELDKTDQLNEFNKYIDIVYTWVDLTPEFEKERNEWMSKEGLKVSNNKQFTNHNELKYSIRSIKKYFPNYRNIYIVVKDGQYPNFLDNYDNIYIINHSQIIPKKYLPTFNSMVIEAYLHYIPNLSDYYLYLNDDLMMLKKLSDTFFIDTVNNKPIVYFSQNKKSEKISDKDIINYKEYTFIDGWCYNNYLLDKLGKYEKDRYTVSHIPKIYRKTYDFIIENKLKEFIPYGEKNNIYDISSMSKFRKNNNLFLNVLLKPYLYHYLFDCEIKKTDELYIRLDNDDQDKIDRVLTSKNTFLAINDELDYNKDYKMMIEKYQKIMDKKFN